MSAKKRNTDRREFLKVSVTSVGGLFVYAALRDSPPGRAAAKATEHVHDWKRYEWAYAVDTTKCIGCGSCMRACRAENRVPKGYHRTWVERYEITEAGKVHVDVALGRDASFQSDALPKTRDRIKGFAVPKLCNHCRRSVCSQVCPVGASYQTPDGVVLVDKGRCVGCAYCIQACPYGTRFLNPDTHVADKCTFCYHRITKGMKPACVLVCPVGARSFGNLKDHRSDLARILRDRRYSILKPEMGTHPKVYYIGLDLEVK